jgi:hypothetical protein
MTVMGRTWQVVVAGLSVAIMIVTLVVYLRDDASPPKSTSSAPHVGAQHHTAEKHEGDARASIQPLAMAKAGDWLAYETQTTFGTTAPMRTTTLVTIEAVDDRLVTLTRREHVASLEPPTVTRVTRPRENPTIDELVGNSAAEWTLHGLTQSDEPHEVGGRTFTAKKLVFTLTNPLDPTKRATVEAWFSAEVPIEGLVEARQELGRSLRVTNRLLGFGTSSATTWGVKPGAS